MGIFMQWRELGSHLTLRWRGVDSKFQFRATVGGLARRRNARSEQSTAFCREIEFAMDLPLAITSVPAAANRLTQIQFPRGVPDQHFS